MTYNPEQHHRRSIRLKNYDYRLEGAYFVTICTKDKECILGTIHDGTMYPNEIGKTIQSVWDDLPSRFPNILLDYFVIMPNHVHGIIVIQKYQEGAINRTPTLGNIIRVFKAVSTQFIRKNQSPRFALQTNYYDHIIRNEKSLNEIKQYIFDNPLNWEKDEENPLNKIGP